jgi:hypothetical protein
MPSVFSSRECKSLMRGVISEALASRKVVCREAFTEGSETAKFGTDEQERHMRQDYPGKQPASCDAPRKKDIQVDAAGIGGRMELLPGEVSPDTRCQARSQQRS